LTFDRSGKMNAGEAVTLLSGKRTFTTKADIAKKKKDKTKERQTNKKQKPSMKCPIH